MRPALIVLLSFSGLLAAAAPARAGGSLNGTWSGSETLGGYGRLTFRFSGGSVQMIDAKDVVNGSYSHSGGQVTLSFYNNNVIYRGTVSGNSMSGSATNGRVNWSWSVSHSGGGTGFGGGQRARMPVAAPVHRGPSAEERARMEARRRELEQARQAAARRAREQARLREQARQQAQEKARQKAQQQAREQARQKAQQQAREQARKKAQEQVRQQQLQREHQQARKPARPQAQQTHRQPTTQHAKHKPRQPSRQPGNQLARQPAPQKIHPPARPPVNPPASQQANQRPRPPARQPGSQLARQPGPQKIRPPAKPQASQQAKRPPQSPARPSAPQLAAQQARPQAPLTRRPTLQGSYTPGQPIPQPASPTPAALAAQAARQKTGQMLDQLTTLLSNNWVDPGPYITGDTDSSSAKSGDLYSVEYYRQGSKAGELYGMYSSKAAADKAKKEVEKWAATITDPDWKIGKIAVEKVGGSSAASRGGKTGITYQDDAPKRQADAAPRATATPRPGEGERAGEKGKLPPALERLKDGVELGGRVADASEKSLELLKRTLVGRERFLERAIAGARANARSGGSAAQRFLRAAEAELGAVRNELRTFEKAERFVKQAVPALEVAGWGIWLGETLRATRSAPAGEKLNTFLEKSMGKVAGELTKELIVGAFVAETAGLGLLELPAAVAVASVAGDLVEHGVERFLRWRRGAKAEE